MFRATLASSPLIGLFAIGLVGCAAPLDGAEGDPESEEPVELGEHSQAIEGGMVDASDPAVGIVLSNGAFCTGTLISQSIVLTAAHCLDEGPVHSFYTGNGAPSPTPWPPSNMTRHEVDAQVAHPSYRRYGNPEEGTSGIDIALLHLKTPLCTIKPWPVQTMAPLVSSTCVAIGFGTHTEAGVKTYAQKRSCTEELTGVFGEVLTLAPLSGHSNGGDSGGPILCDWGGIAGVVSGHVSLAPDRLFAARIDVAADWIQATMATMTRPLERIACSTIQRCTYCGSLWRL